MRPLELSNLRGVVQRYVLFVTFSVACAIMFTWDTFEMMEMTSMIDQAVLQPELRRSTFGQAADVSPKAMLSSSLLDNNSCLSPYCIQQVAKSIVMQPFQARNISMWCHNHVPASVNHEASPGGNQGLLLVRTPYSGSSLAAGALLRAHIQNQCQATIPQLPHVMGQHFANRDPQQSFLLTTIRDPGERALSHIYSRHVGMNQINLTAEALDQFVIQSLSDETQTITTREGWSKGPGNFQLRYIAQQNMEHATFWDSNHPTLVQNPQLLVSTVQAILGSYNLILVADRIEESLVAMALLLGIDITDVLVTSSQTNTSYFYYYHSGQCHAIPRPMRSDVVREYLESPIWRAQNYGDLLLHQAAHAALDRTIQHVIGPQRFARALQRFQQLVAMEQKHCAPHVQFPCSKKGQPQLHISNRTCYREDQNFGCGFRCINELVEWEKERFPVASKMV